MSYGCQTGTVEWLKGGVILLALLPAACASVHTTVSTLPPLQNQVPVEVPAFNFHAVSPPMEEFLDQYVPKVSSTDRQAWDLVGSVTNRDVFPFEYDASLTQSSEQTFASHKGNCLAFSSMLVAMARHRGLKAWYQEVEIPPQWSSVNNTLLVSKHINVVVEGKFGQWVVDVSGERAAVTSKVKRITDAEALAQYYNNLGADALLTGELATAYAYITKALQTRPRLAWLWSNLAVVYSHNGQRDDAAATYLAALELSPNNAVAANNLYLIYESEGKHEAAQKLLYKVERHRRNNPYYLYHLSELAFDEGRYEESREMLEEAIGINRNEYRFHYELARLLATEGNLVEAQASLDRALELAPEYDRLYNGWMDGIRVEALPPLPN
jgi:tetratricopeptide (TPR) repeat protein